MSVVDAPSGLLGRFCLFYDSNLVAPIYELLDVFIEHFLGEAHMEPLVLALVAHPGQIEQTMAKNSVCMEHLVKLSQLKEDDFVEVLLFDLPVLCEGA